MKKNSSSSKDDSSTHRSSGPVNILETLAPNRECGDCIACCQILEIETEELTKAANQLCSQNSGNGCDIYDTRPDVCRSWYCLWRRIDAMPVEIRPDRIGVVFSIDTHEPPRTPFEQFYIVARCINGPDDFKHPSVQAALNMFIDEGHIPVWLSYAGTKKLIYPAPDLAKAIVTPGHYPEKITNVISDWRRRLKINL